MKSKLLMDAVKVDIFDNNYALSSERLGLLSSIPDEALPRKGLFVRIAAFFFHFLWELAQPRSFFHFLWELAQPRSKHRHCPPQPVVFFATTMNQRDSISPVAEYMNNAFFVCTNVRPGASLGCEGEYSLALAYLLSLPFLPLVIREFWRARGYRRKSFHVAFDGYWLSYGHYLCARLWLRRIKARAVVIANDHTIYTRTFVKAARDEGIITIYMEHGAASTRRAPLMFDYALLGGRDSLNKYDVAGPSSTKVFLIGKPRFDANYQYINVSRTASSIGICTNALDPSHRVDQLCERLRQRFPNLNFSIRPHPGDKRMAWADLSKKHGMDLSDWRVESPFDFLERMDVIIAGDSSIHSEAALMNTYPLFYDFSLKRLDPYDFQRNGLVDYVSDPDEICNRIERLSQHKPYVRTKAKPYVATVGTCYDGRSGELSGALIKEIALSHQVRLERWRRVPGVRLEAYELANDIEGVSD